jgi:hypothetical protein
MIFTRRQAMWNYWRALAREAATRSLFFKDFSQKTAETANLKLL